MTKLGLPYVPPNAKPQPKHPTVTIFKIHHNFIQVWTSISNLPFSKVFVQTFFLKKYGSKIPYLPIIWTKYVQNFVFLRGDALLKTKILNHFLIIRMKLNCSWGEVGVFANSCNLSWCWRRKKVKLGKQVCGAWIPFYYLYVGLAQAEQSSVFVTNKYLGVYLMPLATVIWRSLLFPGWDW